MKQFIMGAVMVLIFLGRADAAENFRLTTAAFQEVTSKDEKGNLKVTRVPVEKVVPGTEVLYVIAYKNEGKKPAESVVITNPVPATLVYTSASEDKSDLAVSVDHGKTYNKLALLKVADPDGKIRPAKSSDVTDLKWSLKSSIKPGDEGSVFFKAILK